MTLILGILLVVAAAFIVYFYVHVRRQRVMLRVQSQKQDALNNEKQQLIMLVSHDLKGPFNRIYALTQLLEMTGTFSDEQKEYLDKMYSIIGDGLNMVRNVVDVRRLEEKGLDPFPEKLNLSQVISPIIKQYNVLADKKQIKIHYSAPERIEMTSDKNYISRVMENLLSNALKFSQPGKEISVSIGSNGSNVEIAVADQGPGLNDQDLAGLYQKFRKLTPRPTAGESSQGLGLSIVKTLSRGLGGDVSCKSELEIGSTFTVILPLVLIK